VKFGTAEGSPSAVPNFMLIREYLGFPAQKTPKIAKIFNFVTPQGRTPCPMSMKS